MDKTTLKEIQTHLDQVCKDKGWDKNSVPEVFILFSEEIGELAKAIRKMTGFKKESSTPDRKNLEEEFADVFNYLLELANRFDVDLTKAYFEKHRINEKRKW